MSDRRLKSSINRVSFHAGIAASGLWSLVFEPRPMSEVLIVVILWMANAAMGSVCAAIYQEELDKLYPKDGWHDV